MESKNKIIDQFDKVKFVADVLNKLHLLLWGLNYGLLICPQN